MDKNKRRTQIYLILFIFIFVMIITVGTYAYFITKDFTYGNFNVNVETKGVDTLQMKKTNDAVIKATDYNFIKSVGHSVSGETIIDVILDTTKKSAKYCYDVSINLPQEKIFEYSNYPNAELSLNVYSKTDNEDYHLVLDNEDITQKTGKLSIPINLNIDNYEHSISTTKRVTKVISYKAMITFNYFKDIDQDINANKTYNASLNIDNVREC